MLRKASSPLCPPNHVSCRGEDRSPFGNPLCALPHTSAFCGFLRSIKLDLLPRDNLLLIFRLLLKLIAFDRAFFAIERILCEIALLLASKSRARSIQRRLRGIAARLKRSLRRDKLANDFRSPCRLN